MRKKFVHGTVNTYKRHGCRCDACRDARRQEQKRYRESPRVKAQAAEYMKRERVRYAEHQRAFRQTRRGKELHVRSQHRRDARKLEQFIEDVTPAVLYQMYGGMCGICKDFVSEDEFHIDHITPLSKGGAHGYVNCQPAHPLCNMRKHDKVLVEL